MRSFTVSFIDDDATLVPTVRKLISPNLVSRSAWQKNHISSQAR